MALSPGSRLGPYEIQSLLGAGGMGEVYRAKDTRLDRIVAIKVLPEQLAADPQFRERLGREARTISQLDHPHICALYDVGEERGTSFLVMQYLEGETLADRLTKGALPMRDALAIAIQVASALDAAHRAGITHRDLKPGNIMLTKAGVPQPGSAQAKLLDFGLAKNAPAVAGVELSKLPTTPAGLTVQGTILGTFQYMAPEQLEGQEADARTDIFAFGAVVYEMLTGRKAFVGKTHASLISAILKDTPPPIVSLQPLASPVLDRIVSTCLAKEPDDRWQSTRDLLRELQWIAEGSPVVAARGRATTKGWPWLVAATALVLGLLAGGWAALRFRPPAGDEPAFRLQIDPPDGGRFVFGNNVGGIALSPDGRTAAFIASGNGKRGLWVRPLDGTTARLLSGTEGAGYPFWSPDSRSIAFLANGKLQHKPGGTDLWLVETQRGLAGSRLSFTPGLHQFPVWSSDRRTIVFASGGTLNLFQTDVSGTGNEQRLTQSPQIQNPTDLVARRSVGSLPRARSRHIT